MVSITQACEVFGLEAVPVTVEVDISPGLPRFTIVGLPDTAVNESKERVRSALRSAGFKFPMKRMAVNLAPAHLKKLGSRYDLAMAVAILVGSDQLESKVNLPDCIFAGELSFSGEVNRVTGVLPQAILARETKKTLIIPWENYHEAAIIRGVTLIPVKRLDEIINILRGDAEIPSLPEPLKTTEQAADYGDFSQILSQHFARRGFEIAAAGFHNMLMVGPPGSGKTLMARTFATIMPPLTEQESIETTRIFSIAGLLKNGQLIRERVIRSPHPSISDVAMVGGTASLRPGEVTLAHNGILFLDELAEFRRSVLETLRTPLSEGNITVTRASGTINYPARFLFIGATNPCPCGYHGDSVHHCNCNEYQVRSYRAKLSGPILDRIDLHVEVSRVNIRTINRNRIPESSSTIRKRVIKAKKIQEERFKGLPLTTNSQMGIKEVEIFCKLPEPLRHMLGEVTEKMGLSLRAYHKILKVARTIADLEAEKEVNRNHLLEAVSYRFLDRTSPF